MKTSAIIRIVIFSLVIVLLSFILLSVLDHNYYIESGRFDTDFEINSNNGIYIHGEWAKACQIKVSALSGDVRILKGVPVQQTNN